VLVALLVAFVQLLLLLLTRNIPHYVCLSLSGFDGVRLAVGSGIREED
jgi:hypothetical protein